MTEKDIWQDYSRLHSNSPRTDSEEKVDFYYKNSEFIKRSQKITDPDLTIIIPAYNEAAFLPRTLASINLALSKHREIKTNVIVVNNASTDDTREISGVFGVMVIDEPQKGIGRARQEGLNNVKASTRYILTTDADSVVPVDWISYHQRALSNENIVFSYGDINFVPDKKLNIKDRSLLFAYTGVANLVHTVKNRMGVCICGAANTGFNKDIATRVGGYNVDLSKGEDTDLMTRISQHGDIYKINNNTVTTSARRIISKGILVHGFSRLKENINHAVSGDISTSKEYDDFRVN